MGRCFLNSIYMRPFKYIILLALTSAAVSSCLIKNDMSYPRIRAAVTSFEVKGQKSVTIDENARTVSVSLDELSDISAVEVVSASMTEGAVCSNFPEPGDVLDLTTPAEFVLRIYQDYRWTVSATQTIERYVRCDNQSGDAYINLKDRTVTVYVSDIQPLSSVNITSMKLGPEGSEVVSTTGYEYDSASGEYIEKTRSCSFPMVLDCMLDRTFTVVDRGEESVWTLSVVQKSVDMSVTSVNAWCYHADVSAVFTGSGTPYLEYRPQGSEEWVRFDDVSVDGLNVTATIPGPSEGAGQLSSGTPYEVCICTESSRSVPFSFTTGTPDQISNMGFEDWYQNGAVWYPVAENAFSSKVWDSANKGVAGFLKVNSTTPSDNVAPVEGSTKAAKLTNMYAVIRFAAGNILTGNFVGLDGLGAVMTWGTPFTARPKAIKGYYSYNPGKLDYIGNVKTTTDELDKCQILVMLTDWDAPFEVNTTKGVFVDQDNDPHIIAYYKFESDAKTDGYVPFEFDLDYRRTDATPKYVVVIACASYKGDEFTGSLSSEMYVDQFEFVYD